MKPTQLLLALVALAAMTGCSATVQTTQVAAKAEARPARAVAQPAADSDELRPYRASYLSQPPGQMEMSWKAPPPPPVQKVRAKKAAKPFQVSKKKRSMLFALPTR